MTPPVCPTCGKLAFPTADAAEAHATHARLDFADAIGQAHVYTCRRPGPATWHMTSTRLIGHATDRRKFQRRRRHAKQATRP